MALSGRTSSHAVEVSVERLLGLSGSAYRVALRIVGSRVSAEDVVQQAYLEALVTIRAGSPPQEERTWFLKVVANLAKKHLRGEARRRKREATVETVRESTHGAGDGLVSRLGGALAMLDDKYRLPVCLCYEEGLTQREAAEVLEMPERTLARYVSTGLAKLRKALERAGYPAAVAAVLGGLKQTAPAVPASLAERVEALVSSGARAAPSKLASRAARKSSAAKGGYAMKILTGIVLAGAVATGVAVVSGGQDRPAPLPAEKPAGEIPMVVLDENVPRWFVDRFAGNSTAGPRFLQGPAREVGGLGPPFVAPAPDGTVFLGSGGRGSVGRISKVTPEGVLLLLAEVHVESIGYSPVDKSIYFVHRTIPCVRRLFQKDGEWRVEVVAGSPGETGSADGAAEAARFQAPKSLAITSKGTVYVLDGTSHLRKIEGGEVSTVAKFKGGKSIVDGPLAGATLSVTQMSGMICLGDNDDTLYVADHWHFCARKIDLKTKTIETVVGMPPPKEWRKGKQTAIQKRYNSSSDGPALTHASFNSGCAFVMWDPAHKALWCGGPDESRLRWVKNGWVRTVIPAKGDRYRWPQNALGVPGTDTSLVWTHVRAVDNKGRAYIISGSSKTGVWRAYEKGGAQ